MKILRPILLAIASLFVLTHTAQAHYDPNIGRWISRDPIGEEGGLNIYGFIDNNPIGFTDTLGLQPTLSFKSIQEQEGNCGNFRWDVQWEVKGEPGEAMPRGVIFQQVKIEITIEPCNDSPFAKGSSQVINEAWNWPGSAGDTWSDKDWMKGLQAPCKGTIKYDAGAYFSEAIVPGFKRFKPVGVLDPANPLITGGKPLRFADFVADPDRPPKGLPQRASNVVRRIATITFDCCKGAKKTKLEAQEIK
ncbi:MAG: RHS repeat-associated core domain-containing protein [Verrucomicrobiota bacterium]